MKKISITLFSIIAMAGVAYAQGAGGSAAAGAKVDAKAGAGVTGTAKAAGGAATGAAKQAGGAAGGATAQAGAKVEAGAAPAGPPKPPAEIKATLKAMGTRSNCKGTGLGPDMKTMVDFKGTSTSKVVLDGWWIQGSMTGTMTGADKKKLGTMKMESFMTYDAATSKWRTIGMMNDGASMHGWAEIKDGKYEGTAEMTGAMGSAQFKEHGDMTDPKVGMKMWGEMSMDKGKTWTKVYEMACKK